MIRVLMHLETGDLYEHVFGGCFGPWICWEDLTTDDRKEIPISAKSPIMFSDDPRYELGKFHDLGEL